MAVRPAISSNTSFVGIALVGVVLCRLSCFYRTAVFGRKGAMEGVIAQRQSLKFKHQMLGHLPPQSHPNYKLWRNYALFAAERGRLVTDILQGFMELRGARILDVGCGVGGASLSLAERGASVLAVDANAAKVAALRAFTREHGLTVQAIATPVEELSADAGSFHAAVLQDVLEHLPDPAAVVKHLTNFLKPKGLLYISTPNRWSPLNMLCDPHWNLPIVGMLSRKGVRFVIKTFLKREETERVDMAVLLSFSRLHQLLTRTGFKMKFVNRQVARKLLKEPRCVLNCHWHLVVIASIKRLGLGRLLLRIVNDRPLLFNRVINPTWYLVARKL